MSIFIQAQLPSTICLPPSPHAKLQQSNGNLQEVIFKAGSSPAGTGVCQTVKQFVNYCLQVVQLLFLHHFPFHLLNLCSLLLLVTAGSTTSWHTAAVSLSWNRVRCFSQFLECFYRLSQPLMEYRRLPLLVQTHAVDKLCQHWIKHLLFSLYTPQ